MSKATVLALVLVHVSSVSAETAFHTSPACWTEPRIYAESRNDDPALEIRRMDALMPGGEVLSPNGAYAFAMTEEVVSERGTSRAELTIYNERAYVLRILLPEVRGIGQVEWINEHLLFLRIWWGRIAGTDYIIDVEREQISSQQAFRYGAIAFQQFQQQCEAPEWSSSDACRCYPGAPRDWRPPAPASDPMPNSR